MARYEVKVDMPNLPRTVVINADTPEERTIPNMVHVTDLGVSVPNGQSIVVDMSAEVAAKLRGTGGFEVKQASAGSEPDAVAPPPEPTEGGESE